jgi:hypothetical protein
MAANYQPVTSSQPIDDNLRWMTEFTNALQKTANLPHVSDRVHTPYRQPHTCLKYLTDYTSTTDNRQPASNN